MSKSKINCHFNDHFMDEELIVVSSEQNHDRETDTKDI